MEWENSNEIIKKLKYTICTTYITLYIFTRKNISGKIHKLYTVHYLWWYIISLFLYFLYFKKFIQLIGIIFIEVTNKNIILKLFIVSHQEIIFLGSVLLFWN